VGPGSSEAGDGQVQALGDEGPDRRGMLGEGQRFGFWQAGFGRPGGPGRRAIRLGGARPNMRASGRSRRAACGAASQRAAISGSWSRRAMRGASCARGWCRRMSQASPWGARRGSPAG